MKGITAAEITSFSKYVLDISGIYLDQSKGYLLETRLKELGKECKATSYSELLKKIKSDVSQKLEKKLIDAITTNETYFFRDNVPFDLLRNKIVPDLIDIRKKQYSSGPMPIKVWCAASSTGQEIYSIAITLSEMLVGMGKFDISILGTDISTNALAQASYGKYSRFEVERGLPSNLRNKYFSQSGKSWRIKDNIRALAKFEKLNLMKPFPAKLGPFDIIFCRNVAIYFQTPDKIKLFKKIAKVLSPGGSLIVGGSENLSSFAPDFVSRQYLRGVYFSLKKDIHPKNETKETLAQLPQKKRTKPIRPTRKSVYDTKASKKVSVEKPSPSLQNNKSSKSKGGKILASIERKTISESDSIEKKSLLAKKTTTKLTAPEIIPPDQEEKQGTSLLGSIGKQKTDRTSFLAGKTRNTKAKTSLLDQISRQNQDD